MLPISLCRIKGAVRGEKADIVRLIYVLFLYFGTPAALQPHSVSQRFVE